ncbi:MAG TPA: phenylalanine--tRNA ligase subunit beta [Candidatus Omnitrophica bacterium]|nr:MAG: phenylalanine--tRNA ligase subunit beta [Omnitrophica WOR_2 bacterium GWA2_53_43]HCI44560.1 phenylalanine--tRNA ligase subunit beta [Candidatus Omnitrophota bacterium]
MKFSLNWLRDYVTIGVSPERLAHKLTMAGLEVEKVATVDGDTVFELEITPNRPDCLNMLGLAREVSAILNVSRKMPKIKPLKPSLPLQGSLSAACGIKILDKKGCPRYNGTLIRDVRVGETSGWIRKRLAVLGMRPINNVVDITNFCLLETGQPLHAFDYDKLEGGKVVVRRAREGETIVGIDGVEYGLDPSILVIADARRPVAIAGVMGGKDTEVTAATKNILLESAYFDPVLVRRASRALGVSSESSYRFERGVDYETVEAGARRAVGLILDSAGGNVAGRSDEETGTREKSGGRVIAVTKDGVNAFLGSALTTARCKKILQRLGCAVAAGPAGGGAGRKGVLKVTPPAFRKDIKDEVDVVEEIARVVGYDELPASLPAVAATNVVPGPSQKFRPAIRVLLLAQGASETVTYAMISEKDLARSGQAHLRGVKIQNPLAQDQGLLRPSLLPSLLSVVVFNINRGQKNLRLFELGKIYGPRGEQETLGVIMTGRSDEDWRKAGKPEADFYDIKGVVEQAIARTCRQGIRFENGPRPFFEKGQGASVLVQGADVGFLGKIEEDVLINWDIKQKNVFFAQINLEELRRFYSPRQPYRSVSQYPVIVRDVSLAVKTSVQFQQVCATAFRLGSGILNSVKFNEEYLGEKIPAGQRGIVFSLRYKAADRTLREEEVNDVHAKILRAFVEEMGAVQR